MRDSHSPVAMRLGLVAALTTAALPVSLLATATSTAMAQAPSTSQTLDYAIPAGPLAEVLAAIAQHSGAPIDIGDSVAAHGYSGAAVTGRLSTTDAVEQAIRGTGLRLQAQADGKLRVVEAPQQSASGIAQLSAIQVIGQLDEGYNPYSSSGALRTDTPLLQTPRSVQIISGDLIRDRQASSLADALRNSAAISARISNRGDATFWSRGYAITNVAVDGVNTTHSRYGPSSTTPIDGIERVEVIKGPDSILAGDSSPGGGINIVRKGPLADPLHGLTTELTDRSELKTSLDLGGPLSADRQLRYRLNLSRMRSDQAWADYEGERSDFIAPVIGWYGAATEFKLGAELLDARQAGPTGTFVANGEVQRIPRYRLGGADDHHAIESTTLYYELSHHLSDQLTFNSKLTYLDSDSQVRLWEARAIADNGDLQYANRLSNRNLLESWSTQNDLRGEFDTGPVSHKVLAGVDYQTVESSAYDLSMTSSGGFFPPPGRYNYWDPSSIHFDPIAGTSKADLMYTYNGTQQGLLLQDQMSWGNLHLVLGARRTDWDFESRALYTNRPARLSSIDMTKWIPSYGLVYDLTPNVSAYGSLIYGFSANATTRDGEALPPTTSTSGEVGFKFALLDGQLSLTTALFDIRQDNLVVLDALGEPIGSEGRRSRGFDLDLDGQVSPGWNVTFSYTYSSFDDPAPSNRWAPDRVIGQPIHAANLWTRYEVQSGALKGWGLGGGIETASGTANGAPGGYFDLPGWAQVDASIFYREEDWGATLGVNNLFDRDLYYSSTTSTWLPVRDPRTIRLTASYRF